MATLALIARGVIASPLLWSTLYKPSVGSPLGAGKVAAQRAPRALEISDAHWTLDEPRLRYYLKNGWDPNWLLDSEGSAALHLLLLVCERNPTHDRAGLARIAQFLVAAGADPTTHNKWGDMIASAPKYCGPDHPVVAYLRLVTARPAKTR